jgi:hypothetical protein
MKRSAFFFHSALSPSLPSSLLSLFLLSLFLLLLPLYAVLSLIFSLFLQYAVIPHDNGVVQQDSKTKKYFVEWKGSYGEDVSLLVIGPSIDLGSMTKAQSIVSGKVMFDASVAGPGCW